MPDPQPLTIGRIVHVRLPAGAHKGECRPALVVQVWSLGCANLQVFLNGHSDDGHGLLTLAPGAIALATSVTEDADPPIDGGPLWHWPERA
ncbi:MAG: hypothetical protein AB7G21_09765 [Dehalococcoidia bacterium]